MSDEVVGVDLTNKIVDGKLVITDGENLLLNIMAGVQYEHLRDGEKALLRKDFGENWKKDLFGIDD